MNDALTDSSSLQASQPHVEHLVVGARMRVLAVGASAVEPRDPGGQPRVVVVDEHQILGGVAVEPRRCTAPRTWRRRRTAAASRRVATCRARRPRCRGSPRLAAWRSTAAVTGHLLGPRRRPSGVASAARTRASAPHRWPWQRRPMPREMSFHATPPLAKPCWQDSSASTSSGVANPPGPRNVRKLSSRRWRRRLQLVAGASSQARDVHGVGRGRIEGAHRDGHDVVDDRGSGR